MESLKDESGPFMQFHCQNINEFVKDKAEKELGETRAKRKECLFELRKLIESEQNLVACISDDFLLQFLRSRKFDTERAFALLKKYYMHRLDYPSLHKKFPLSCSQEMIQKNIYSFLSLRTHEGCAVWVVRVGLWDPDSFTFEDLFSLSLTCQEHALMNPVTQICGIVSIVDLKGLSLSQLFHISRNSIVGLVKALQDCFPFRHKAIHIINHPRIFNILFAIIKPLLTPKMRNRIHFHDDERSLLKFFPTDILPEIFGGTLETFENEQFINSLLSYVSEVENFKTYGYATKGTSNV